MKKDKKIDELFRANQHRYSERPSPAAWRELNRRLEENRRKNPIFNPMAAAATIIAIVGIIALLTLFAGNKKSLHYADNRPQELKELTEVPNDARIKIVMEFTREYHDRLSNPLGD